MRKIFNTIKAGVQAVKEKFVAIHAVAERKIHRISAKIKTAAFRLVIHSNAMLTATRGENFVDSGIKILIAVVIGAPLLGGLYALFGATGCCIVNAQRAARMPPIQSIDDDTHYAHSDRKS